MRKLIAFGVHNPVLVNLLMVCMLVGGYVSARGMIRERFPEFSIDRIAVDVTYPGAGPADVESAVCTPIEQAVRGIDGIRELSSLSSEGHGLVVAFLTSDADPARVLDDMRVAVDQVNSLPPEAEKPIVREMVIRVGVINIAVYGQTSERTLKHIAQDIRDELTEMEDISQVALWGVRDDEITIELSEEALRTYGLTFGQVMRIVAQNSLDLPAGLLKTSQEEFTLRVAGRRMTAADYEQLIVISHRDGTQIPLGRIATIREGFEDAQIKARFNGEPAVVVAVFKTPQQDTVKIAGLVREVVARQSAEMPDRIRLACWGDGSVGINSRIDMLVRNGLSGIVLVLLSLWLFLRFRVALWVMMGVPVAFAGALIIMNAQGQTLNMISLFGLIMVMGMIVDDAIVISENVYTRYQRGEEPALAAVNGPAEVGLPVLGSSATTVVAFIPLLFVTGIMGKFIAELPVVVMAAIAASAIEAFLILPSHLHRHGGLRSHTAPPRRTPAIRRRLDLALQAVIEHVYRPFYRVVLAHRYLTASAAICLLLVACGLVWGGRTPLMLLSKEDSNLLRVRVAFPEGTPAETTRRLVERVERQAWALNDDGTLHPASRGPLVENVYSTIGFWNDFLPRRGNNLCEVKIALMEAGQRRIRDRTIMEAWRNAIGTIPNALVYKIEPDAVAPTDRPVEIRLLGNDLDDLHDAAERLTAKLREFDGVISAHHDLIPGKRELRVSLKPEAASLGLTLRDVADQLRQGFFGGRAVRLQRQRDEVWVRVRYPSSERRRLEDLENVRIRTGAGTEIPFHEAANVVWGRGYASIRHEAGQRKVEIKADLDERRANGDQITTAIESTFLPQLLSRYNNIHYRIAGQREIVTESLESLSRGFALALIGMYALLASMLRSYLQPIVIMTAVPFGLVGAVAGHLIMGYDLTLMSVFGMVALAGVVVNDTLVLIDYINARLRDGSPVLRAVHDAGVARFRPVVLTSITTVAGLMPLLWERSGQAFTVIPMAISLAFGLLFATGLTLLLVPALFLILNDAKRAGRWLVRGGSFPSPEVVESPGSAAKPQALQPG